MRGVEARTEAEFQLACSLSRSAFSLSSFLPSCACCRRAIQPILPQHLARERLRRRAERALFRSLAPFRSSQLTRETQRGTTSSCRRRQATERETSRKREAGKRARTSSSSSPAHTAAPTPPPPSPCSNTTQCASNPFCGSRVASQHSLTPSTPNACLRTETWRCRSCLAQSASARCIVGAWRAGRPRSVSERERRVPAGGRGGGRGGGQCGSRGRGREEGEGEGTHRQGARARPCRRRSTRARPRRRGTWPRAARQSPRSSRAGRRTRRARRRRACAARRRGCTCRPGAGRPRGRRSRGACGEPRARR